MDVEVELHFSSRSVLLLVPGVAATLYAGDERDVTIYQHMQQAAKFGARFYACTDAIAAHSIDPIAPGRGIDGVRRCCRFYRTCARSGVGYADFLALAARVQCPAAKLMRSSDVRRRSHASPTRDSEKMHHLVGSQSYQRMPLR